MDRREAVTLAQNAGGSVAFMRWFLVERRWGWAVAGAVLLAAVGSAARFTDVASPLPGRPAALLNGAHGRHHLYPRGAFEWCPSLAGMLPVDRRSARSAARVAIRFDLALHRPHSVRSLAQLEDPTLTPDARALDRDMWAMTWRVRGVRVVASGPGSGDSGLAAYGCGPRVAARTWIISLHDASRTASAGGAAFFLDRRHDGWMVWGAY